MIPIKIIINLTKYTIKLLKVNIYYYVNKYNIYNITIFNFLINYF